MQTTIKQTTQRACNQGRRQDGVVVLGLVSNLLTQRLIGTRLGGVEAYSSSRAGQGLGTHQLSNGCGALSAHDEVRGNVQHKRPGARQVGRRPQLVQTTLSRHGITEDGILLGVPGVHQTFLLAVRHIRVVRPNPGEEPSHEVLVLGGIRERYTGLVDGPGGATTEDTVLNRSQGGVD